jgi:hypothetical protein
MGLTQTQVSEILLLVKTLISEVTMASESTSNWICQSCRKPILDGDGTIEIININQELGAVGDYPKLASGTEESAELISTTQRVLRLITPNSGLIVYHNGECDPHPNNEGYWLSTARATTLEAWCSWVLHIFEKTWMGKNDLSTMLSFWWTHKNEEPPSL